MILPWISLIKTGVTAWMGHRAEVKAGERKKYLAELEAGIHDPEKLRVLKWASFIQFSAPIWLTAFWPGDVQAFLENLNKFPSWYIEIYIGMNGAIWGAAMSKDVIVSTIKAWRKSVKIK